MNDLNTNNNIQSESRLKYDHDVCGQELLKLVARGSAIIAEILRLKDYIPEFYSNEKEEKKYSNIIFNFSYFENVDAYEDKINNSIDIRNLDEEFRENYIEILERFYLLFYSIYQYICDLESYVEQVNDGIFVQHTLETILMSKEIRHLLCEAVFLYGIMLLLVDRLIQGNIREKMIVSYYRYKGQSTIRNFNFIVKLFSNTGYVYVNNKNEFYEKKPKKYPIDYFDRKKIDRNIIKLIIGFIKDHDIYDQIAAYPSPEHRSHALSSQAVIIFVLLGFLPEYLELENSKMREIVDKHFSDNWVISLYMGYTVDILDYWKDFKAAKNALAITISEEAVRNIKKNYYLKLLELNDKLKKFLNEGLMNEDYVLDNIGNLLIIMREANVIMRWIILQRTTTNKRYKDIINQDLKNHEVISLLLSVSHFEYLLKNMFQKLISNKENMWNSDKENCVFRLKELSDYFAGLKNFGKQVKQDDFKGFFEKKLQSVQELTFTNSTSAGRKIILIKESLNNIKIYHYIEGNLQIKQYIIEIGNYLNHMLRIVNIKNRVLINIAQISDFSYAWIVIQDYLLNMQEMLKKDSKTILLLRATFLKLASILNFPLVRLFEAESPDISSVTKYYSGELVKFVRNVLQIVPTSVFSLHDAIITIFAKGFSDMPIKLAKSELKDYALFDDRYALAKATHQISLFTKGILMMEKTLMGVVEVDPKNILEDGIRKELLKLLGETFHKSLEFSTCYSITDLNKKLDELNKKILCIKKSFIYIQDYINIDGSRMWSEEMHRLVNYYVDLEANSFLNKKIRIENRYDVSRFSIPRFMPITYTKDLESVTFIGRIIRHCLNITKAKNATFYPQTFTWYDSYNNEVFGIKTFNLIKQFFGVEGLQGINRLITYMNYNSIYHLKKFYNRVFTDEFISKSIKNFMSMFKTPLIAQFTEKENTKTLMSLVSNICKQPVSNLLSHVINIGQLEIFKLLLTHCLKDSLEVESNVLNSHMQNLNNIHLHYLRNMMELKFKIPEIPEDQLNSNNSENINNNIFSSGGGNNNSSNSNSNSRNNNRADSEYIFMKNYYKNLCQLLEDFGFITATKTFYLDLTPCTNLIFTLATLSFNEIYNYYSFNKKTNEITKKSRSDDFDLNYFLYGIMTILYQYSKENIILYLSFLSNMIKQHLLNMYQLKDMEDLLNKYVEYPPTVIFLQSFINDIIDNFEIPLSSFEMAISPFILSKRICSQ